MLDELQARNVYMGMAWRQRGTRRAEV